MKVLMAIFLLSLALQPLDLPGCAMGGDQEVAHHATLYEGPAPDCCNPDSGQPAKDCATTAHCAFLSLGFLVIPAATVTLLPPPDHQFSSIDGLPYSGPPIEPLLRPPTA